MPTYIIKPSRDEDFYVWWSTVVDAPIGWGPRDYVPLGSEGRPERFARADERGTSANWPDWPVEEMPFGWNDSEWSITMAGQHKPPGNARDRRPGRPHPSQNRARW